MTTILEALKARSADLGRHTVVLERTDLALLIEAAEVLEECAADLEQEIVARYGAGQSPYPEQERRRQRDMQPVEKARTILSRLQETP